MTVTASIVHSAERLARLALRESLSALDQRVVLPALGSASPVHRVLTATVGLLSPSATSSDDRPVDDAEPTGTPTADGPTDDLQPAESQADDRPDDAAPAEEQPVEKQPAEEFAHVETAAMETLTDDLLRDQQDERFVGELADDELRRVQAEIRAKQILEDPDHT